MSKRQFRRLRAVHVISEPGDATRYDYYVMKDGPNDYVFAPARSTFRFPQRINYFEGINALDNREDLDKIVDRENCNHWTVIECINCMIDLKDNGYSNDKY